MNKKSLFILLILPFILAISFFAASKLLFTKIEGDVLNIQWDYKNFEAFSIKSGKVRLEAKAVLPDNQGEIDASLLWMVENVNKEEEMHAYIETQNTYVYLVPVSEGDVIVSCRNANGTIQKSFKARIYLDGAIILNTVRARSFDSISGVDYYGEFDFDGNNKKNATFSLEATYFPEYIKDSVEVNTSSNISFDKTSGIVTINDYGDSYVTFDVPLQESFKETTYEFKVVENGYNVYNYNDLLKCTNYDEEGKIVCLQTNLESLKNAFVEDDKGNVILRDNTTEVFGNYDSKTKKFNFKNEVIKIESTYNTEFIDQANAKINAGLSKEVVVGIRIRKDFYGNGYMINAHNLCYPSSSIVTENGTCAALGIDDLFRGPLPFVMVGETSSPIIKSYGQDNIGFYIDASDVTLNDVYFKNSDFSDILENNEYSGTVLDINGDNILIINSHLSSGRNVLRSYSNTNVLVKNCVLEKSREFLAKVGTNEYEKITTSSMLNYSINGSNYYKTRYDFLNLESDDNSTMPGLSMELGLAHADATTINTYLSYSNIIQEALNEERLVTDELGKKIFKNDIVFEDTYFYQSGIFSIGIDTMFNGPYLYNGRPIYGMGVFDDYLYPDNIAGISYPSLVTLKGDTRFYDYKNINSIKLDCLIYEDISNQLDREVTIDQFFPIKTMIVNEAKERGIMRYKDGNSIINTPIVYYGGGQCLSEVNMSQLNLKQELSSDIILDYFAYTLQLPSKGMFVDTLGRAVSMAIGFAPFKTILYDNGYLSGQSLPIENLKARA